MSVLLILLRLGLIVLVGVLSGCFVGVCFFSFQSFWTDNSVISLCLHLKRNEASLPAVLESPLQNSTTEPLTLEQLSIEKLSKKLQRPKFYATELGVREKLIVAIVNFRQHTLTSPVLRAFNETTSRHVNRLVFFSWDGVRHGESEAEKKLLQETAQLFAAVEQLYERYGSKYDWFFIGDDSTFVHSMRLFEFVSHLSSGYTVALGAHPAMTSSSSFCPLHQGGWLLSASALTRLGQSIKVCQWRVQPENRGVATPGDLVGRCAEQIGLTCADQWKGKRFKSSPVHPKLFQSEETAAMLTVSGIKSEREIYELHKRVCELESNLLRKQIDEIDQELLNHLRDSKVERNMEWPSLLAPGQKPQTRFELFHWDYIVNGSIFELTNPKSYQVLSNDDLHDLEFSINSTLVHVDKNNKQKLAYRNFISGYRRFDPSRGLEYIIDLQFTDNESSEKVAKRFRILKPLTRAELVPVHFTPESTRMHLIVSIDNWTLPGVWDFLARFEQDFLADGKSRNMVLLICGRTSDDVAGRLHTLKQRHQASIDFSFVDKQSIIEQYGADKLYVDLGSAGWLVGLNSEFLNRARLNTALNHQIACPIPFVRFSTTEPNAALPSTFSEYPKLSKTNGRFDESDFSVCAFFGADFASSPSDDGALGSMSGVQVMRYADPALIVGFRERDCTNLKIARDQQSCAERNKEFLASKSHMARLLEA